MPTPSSGTISPGDVREEGNKTSWVSSNYPTASKQLDIDPNWTILSSVDTNNQLGFNPDGSFGYDQWFDWDTWKRPTIQNAWVLQQFSDSGAVVYFEVVNGDAFRTAYVVQWSTSSDFSTGVTTEGIYFYDGDLDTGDAYGERSDGSGGSLLDGTEIIALDSNGGRFNSDDYGNADTGSSVDTTIRAELIEGNVDPEIHCMVFSLSPSGGATFENGNSNSTDWGTGPYYFRIIPVDGRLGDTLGFARADDTFTRNPLPLGSYTQGTAEDCFVHPFGDVDSDYTNVTADGKGMYLFSTFGEFSADPGVDFIDIIHNNVYDYYVGEGKMWIAYDVSDGTQRVPNDDGIGWNLYNQLPRLTGLMEDTTYQIWIEEYTNGDTGGPSTSGTPGGDLVVDTLADTLAAPTNVASNIDSEIGAFIQFDVTWDSTETGVFYVVEYSINSSTGPWETLDTTGTDEEFSNNNTLQSQDGFSAGDNVYVRVIAKDGGGGASSPSLVHQVT